MVAADCHPVLCRGPAAVMRPGEPARPQQLKELARVAPEVRDRLVVRFGADVLAWCDALPALVNEFAARWGLAVAAAGGGGTSRVFRCLKRDTGTWAWLKLTPEPEIARQEAEALRAWDTTPSVVTLLAHDPAAGALLLEDVEPGVPVRQRAWNMAEVAALLRDLRVFAPAPGEHSVLRPLSHRVGFVFDLADRRLAAAGVNDPAASAVLWQARAAALELAADGPVGLVHGDLHPANVLSGPDARMVAIDPRPAWGDPDFDAVDWVLEGAADLAVLERRIEELAALVPGQCPHRVLGWCRALAALIAVPRMCAGRDDAQTRFLMALARG
ncbi:aminoglycoside phosphotransferase family protein [Streptosporangium pseudovulgare]|uniref:Aminoglycoside O-phosphotransferase n=1 Tax=Streptosporangium pseudovulgare TaxID=35765 RepID=A0ABQ2RMY1_9ACTN|nr:aminoglycoside phosphotransferase family protein [Streptosporangium pseudovulgare]GGQ35388.1 aminoglycoside O-phosphotransferase [Streptosporangium pseudovulgare]